MDADIRSIFASAHADSRGRAQAGRAHPLAGLDKPCNAETRLSTVRTAIAERANPSMTQPPSAALLAH